MPLLRQRFYATRVSRAGTKAELAMNVNSS